MNRMLKTKICESLFLANLTTICAYYFVISRIVNEIQDMIYMYIYLLLTKNMNINTGGKINA